MELLRLKRPGALEIGDALHRDFSVAPLRVHGLFGSDPRSTDAIVRGKRRIDERWRGDRAALARVLSDACRDRGDHPKACEAAASLAEAETTVVVAVVRPTVLGGPVQSLYKALLAVVYARRFARLTRTRVIPLLWVLTDHNWARMGGLWLLDRRGDPVRIALDPPVEGTPTAAAVDIDGRVHEFRARAETLAGRDQQAPFFQMAGDAVETALDLADWFCLVYAHLLSTLGLVIADSHHPPLRRLISKGLRRYILRAPRTAAEARVLGERMSAAGYPVPFSHPEDAAGLFVEREGQRRAVRRRGSEFAVDGRDGGLEARELLRWLETSPEDFSPGAISFPTVLGLTLPILAHLCEPVESGVMVQLRSGFGLHNLDAPALLPTPNITILDGNLQEAMGLLGLNPRRPGEIDHLEAFLARRRRGVLASVDQTLDGIFTRAESEIRDAYRPVEAHLESRIPGSATMVSRDRDATLRRLQKVRERSERRLIRRASREWRALRILSTTLLPAGAPQSNLSLANFMGSEARPRVVRFLEMLAAEPHPLGSLVVLDSSQLSPRSDEP